jgi:hypothetical protein
MGDTQDPYGAIVTASIYEVASSSGGDQRDSSGDGPRGVKCRLGHSFDVSQRQTQKATRERQSNRLLVMKQKRARRCPPLGTTVTHGAR